MSDDHHKVASRFFRIEDKSSRWSGRLRRNLIDVALIVGIAMMIAICAWLLWDARSGTLFAAKQSEATVTDVLASRIGPDIENLFLSVESVSRAVETPGVWDISPERRQTTLFTSSLRIKSLTTITVFGQDGNLRSALNSVSQPAVNIRDRDYFEYHRTHPDPSIHFSGPMIGRYSGQQVIALSKRLNDSNGNFAGVVAGSLNVAYYESLFSHYRIPGDAVLAMLTMNGGLVLRIPFVSHEVTVNLSRSSLINHAHQSSSGSLIDVSQIDGVDRLVTYRAVEDSPYIIVYARAVDEVLAGWRRLAYSVGIGTLLLCGLEIFFVLNLRRERLRRESAEHHARLSAQVLAAVNRDLEGRIQQEVQIREDSMERLAASQRLEALGQLAGGIAHDINNVLQTISGACTILQMRNQDSQDITRLAGLVLSAADRGSAITRRLLVFARRAAVQAELVDVAALLEDLQEVPNHTLGGSVVVKLDLAVALPPVYVDRMQFETVIINLATNARDAMPDGGEVRIAAGAETVKPDRLHRADLAPGQYVRFDIADTGVGMDEITLQRAVEPFFSTKGPSHGTGLGLSMAKGFAEQANGRLDIVSKPGKGTTVTIWLPVSTVPAQLSQPLLSAERQERELSGLPEPSRILVVDDDRQARELVSEYLQGAGLSALQAPSGEAALSILAAGEPVDLLLTDLSMPRMSGVELIQRVRHLHPDMPVIVLTGSTGAVASLAIERVVGGKCLVLEKPIRIIDLKDNIELVLRRSNIPSIATLVGMGGILATT